MENPEISKYVDRILLLLTGVLFFGFPLLFTSATTDPFTLPKQLLLGGVVVVGMILWAVKMVNEAEVAIRKTPFDLPLIVFGMVLFLSALFSANRSDAIVATIPVLLAILLYFLVVNIAKKESSLLFLLYSLLAGGALLSFFTLLSFFKVYALPFSYTHTRTFTPTGSLLDQAMYLGFLVPFATYFAYTTLAPLFHKARVRSLNNQAFGFGVLALLIALGFVATLFELITVQKPTVLPFTTGLQVGFAAISQDATRIIQSFLFGSGYGTFLSDFTRFKTVFYNQDANLWAFTFFRSSSFLLELLATTGVLGLLSFLFLLFTLFKNKPKKHEGSFGLFLSLFVAVVATLVLPFSFIPLVLFIILLAIFSVTQGLVRPQKVYDIALSLVALRKSLGIQTNNVPESSYSKALPVFVLLLVLASLGYTAFEGVKYAAADTTFESSLLAAQQNQGLQTYDLQNNAIQTFPHRDAFYRTFSQTNLALANSLAASQPKNSSPSAQTQNTIATLVQQSISSAKQAINEAPLTVLNWQNLASIYRSLIGFGQNADQFSIAAAQQAVSLDPTNPQEYINLGGIYYQLNQWDAAITQFTQAVSLKPDFANAHYNLGHAYEAKEDLQDALTQYQAVDILTANDKANNQKIKDEIALLQKKIGSAKNSTANPQNNTGEQPPLGVATPAVQLPQQTQPVKIAAPNHAAAPSPTPAK